MSREEEENHITPCQQEYLNELADGAKTTREIEISMKKSQHAVAKMMRKLRDMGLIRSKRVPMWHGNMWRHERTGEQATRAGERMTPARC